MEGDSCCRSDSLEQAISIHSLRMEGDKRFPILFDNLCISIHSLRIEGDGTLVAKKSTIAYFNPLPPHGGRRTLTIITSSDDSFQSTPSAWRETYLHEDYDADHEISIHSLRMEGDWNLKDSTIGTRTFQSTPSAWRETELSGTRQRPATFQSTPSAWRETVTLFYFYLCTSHFNPLPPHGGRRRHATMHNQY